MSALDTVTNNDGIIRLERSVYGDARAELSALRAELEQAAGDQKAHENLCAVFRSTESALRAELATVTYTAEVWERQHKEIVAELDAARQEILQLSAGEYLLREIGSALGCAPTSDILQRIAEQAAQIEAMDLERGELMLARDYARDEA